jgi:hypothetical protein
MMSDMDLAYHTFSAACLFYMAAYDKAKEAALKGKYRTNSNRILCKVKKIEIWDLAMPCLLGIRILCCKLILTLNVVVYKLKVPSAHCKDGYSCT